MYQTCYRIVSLAIVAAASLWLSLAFSAHAENQHLSELRLGRGLFVEGRRDRTAQACGSCHGLDGRGQSEGDVYVSPIFRGDGGLDRPSRVLRRRSRDAYTRETFERAIRFGVDPMGNQLSALMPRMELQKAELDGLWAYLDQVTSEQQQGIGEQYIVFVVAGPESAGKAVVAVADMLASRFSPEEMWQGLRVKIAPELVSPEQLNDPLYCPGSGALALINLLPGRNGEVMARAKDCGVPVVAPLQPLLGTEDERLVRGISATITDQWNALLIESPGPFQLLVAENISPPQRRLLLQFFGANPQKLSAAETVLAPFGLNNSQPVHAKTVLAPADGSAAGLAGWQNMGATILLADPLAETINSGTLASPLEMHVRVTADVTKQALLKAGSDLNRYVFLQAFDKVIYDVPQWSPLDYQTNRLTGTRTVKVRRVQ